MRRPTLPLAALVGGAAVGVLALAGPAAAHTEAEASAAADGRTRITFDVAAECGDGELPTSGLRVQLPEGATDVQPTAAAGWTTQVTATEMSWSATDPAPGEATFVAEMVLAQAAGETVYLPAIQDCPDGSEIAWIQIPTSPGERLSNPAPEIVVPTDASTPSSAAAQATTSTTGGPTTSATMALEQTPITIEGSETSSAGLIVFIVVLVVIVGGALILFLRYRSKGNQAGGSGPGATPPAA